MMCAGTLDLRQPLFTVFTSTYNRSHTLRRVYESLVAQTRQDFEWLIVDDGSSDGTQEVVNSMCAENRLPIRYVRKSNGGVHTAHNIAIRLAQGKFFLRLDSDDACVPAALESLANAWESIPKESRRFYTGVSCLCMDSHGSIVGDCFPEDGWTSDWATLMRLRGDKWGFHQTAILRRFPFPVFEGERFCPEGLVWGRIHKEYKTFCINEALQIIHPSPDSITQDMVGARYRSPQGAVLYYREQLVRLKGASAFRCAANYIRFSLSGSGIRSAICDAPCWWLVVVTAPIGITVHLMDRIRGACK